MYHQQTSISISETRYIGIELIRRIREGHSTILLATTGRQLQGPVKNSVTLFGKQPKSGFLSLPLYFNGLILHLHLHQRMSAHLQGREIAALFEAFRHLIKHFLLFLSIWHPLLYLQATPMYYQQ
jgi:hypothetical protein